MTLVSILFEDLTLPVWVEISHFESLTNLSDLSEERQGNNQVQLPFDFLDFLETNEYLETINQTDVIDQLDEIDYIESINNQYTADWTARKTEK